MVDVMLTTAHSILPIVSEVTVQHVVDICHRCGMYVMVTLPDVSYTTLEWFDISRISSSLVDKWEFAYQFA